MSDTLNTGTAATVHAFKPFQFIDPTLLDGKRVQGRPVAELLNHTMDVVQGVQTIMGLLEAHGVDQSSDAKPYLDNCTAGTLERLAIRALSQLGRETEAMIERIQADARSERGAPCA